MTLALPNPRGEAWRWSDLSALRALSDERPTGAANDPAPLWIGCGGPRLLFIDGVFQADASTPGPIRIGRTEADPQNHPLATQAGAEGWTLDLGPDHTPSATIEIVHLSTGGANHLAASLRLAANAQASVVETYAGPGWANRLTDVRLARSARLMLSRRVLGDAGFTSLTDFADLSEGASLISVTLGAGAGDTRLDGRITLSGPNAFAEAGGALLARGEQRHDANLVLRHAAPDGQSRQVWRSVADDRATASVAARVEVARAAQKTDAEQSLKGLLLARTATINAKPELEIFADDVKCAHGATVGELDRNALFYLAQRGLPPADGQALLTRAFVIAALDRIGEEGVREAFVADAERWLGGAA
ncbi:SufD family Fe-S cluster assembly protein [Sphingomonas sp. ID0503]|uniref:SufD family Fe-S cluster assembly protein n=1 Tax=Sphingomonas sp. ID0503 TaxID=3399691 RepID=UPI003AFA18AC